MSEKKGKIFDAKTLFFSSAVIILFAILAVLILYSGGGKLAGNNSTANRESDIYRNLANKLKSVGITEEAIKQYENYFNTAMVDKRTRSNLAYTV
ncbi:MAG: hypothetical protein KAR43_14795, partial [Deltaproteobacteria bacterium]|nr:hypothetical protein [Deltaproteobacteria bacterium]